MMDFTLSNCKDLDVRKGTYGITKRFAILLVMMVMITSKALAGDNIEVIDGFRYLLDSDTKTATLLPNTEKYTDDTIAVPESVKAKDGNNYKVTAFGDGCFENYGFIISITIPSSVTSLGKECFENCNGLTSITIPSSVTSLGDECFRYCSGLTSITIPSSVTSLGDRCFSYCSGLTSITIPSSVTSFGEYCFYYCSALTSITIPSYVTSLGKRCFDGCSGLTSLTIPSSVNYLGSFCFDSNLESIYFKGKKPYHISAAEIPTKCIIYVPAEYLQDYKDALGFGYDYIYTWNPNGSGDDDKPVTPCATPSVFYGAGKLKFSCETAGAKYHYTISDKDMATDALSEDGNVTLSAAYDISVYATADGYKTSEKAKATLYWVNANLENATNINQTRTRGVVASAHDGIVSISGLDNGEVVKFYAADGKLIGSSSAVDGTASCAVSETMVIAKFGDNAIKVAVK